MELKEGRDVVTKGSWEREGAGDSSCALGQLAAQAVSDNEVDAYGRGDEQVIANPLITS